MHYNISVDGYKGFRYLNNLETTRSKAIERLSSGYRINHTSDDAAGASMSTAMRSQIRGLTQAFQNSEDMIGLLNTAESSIGAMTEMLQRIRELSVQAASDTNTTEDRMYMQEEVEQLLKEVDRFSKQTEFNGITLFNNDPDVTAKAGGLRAVLGEQYITPNGNLSEKYSTWDILDIKTGGENATPCTFRTVVTTSTTVSSKSEYTYSNFQADSSNYTGFLYDSSGTTVIGKIDSSGVTVNAAGETLLPTTKSNVLGPTTSTKNSYNYTPAGSKDTSNKTETNSSYSRSASNSQVYGKDALGNPIALSYDYTEKKIVTTENHITYADYKGNHIAATINFEKFNQPGGYTVNSLYDMGFDTNCATCGKHYSIKFVEGTEPKLTRNGTNYVLNIGIDVLNNKSTGEDLAKLVVDTVAFYVGGLTGEDLDNIKQTDDNAIAVHFTQYAYRGSKLYLFDRRGWQTNYLDTFRAEVYGEPIKEVSRQPLIHAQVGSNTNDRVAIELPYISLETLKIENVDVTTRESATETIRKMDNTMAFLTKERAKISLWASRLSRSASNADVGAYNNTLSDSKVMDTNYADEVLQLSKAQVLTEFGLSSVTEVHKMIENVLQFIS